MIRVFIRLAALPLWIVLTVLECGVTYIFHFVGMLCSFVSGIVFFLTVAAFVTGIATGPQVADALLGGLILYLIPQITGILLRRCRITEKCC